MNKILILFSFLLTFIISDKDLFLPMNKDSKYGEDICRYYDDGHYYVKPCEKGKYCVDTSSTSSSNLFTCHDIPKVKHSSVITESCKNSFECFGVLECISEKCTISSCLPGEFVDYRSTCRASAEQASDHYCYLKTYDSTGLETRRTYSPAEKNKICGKYNIIELQGNNHRGVYDILSVEYAYKGTVKDGDFVSSKELCESGYALYFYGNGKFDDPKLGTSSGTNSRYLKCITPISVECDGSTCSVLYQLDGEELVYNLDRLETTYRNNIYGDYSGEDFIKIKSERHREFYSNITDEERNTCGELDSKNKYTCENRELIKSWYFYRNPRKYILYNGREKLEKVLDYLIQREYPSYYSSSQFLYIQILLFILILLF